MNSKNTQDNDSNGNHNLNDCTREIPSEQSYLVSDSIEEGDFYQSIYQSTTAAIFVVELLPDDNFRYLAFNPTCETWFSTKVDNLIGKTPSQLFSAEDAKAMMQNYLQCVRSQETISYEESLSIGNAKSWWITNLTPLKNAEGKVYRLIGTSFNINKRKQAEERVRLQAERERLLSAIAQRIGQSLDLDNILQRTVEEVRQFLQTDRVLIYRFEANGQGVMAVESVIPYWKTVLGSDIHDYCLTDDYINRYRQGKIQVIEDIDAAELHPCYVRLLTSFEVKANLVVPIIAEQELWGLLIAQHCRATRQWQTEDIELLKQLATKVGIAVQQAELHQKIQHLNVRLEEQVEDRTSQLQETLEQLKQTLNAEALIRSITEAMRDSLDERQILQAVTRNLAQRLDLECCQMELYNSDRTIARIAYEYPAPLPSKQEIVHRVADFSELYERLLSKQPLHFIERVPTFSSQQQPVTRLACPIFDDRGILGNLWLSRPQQELFKPWEIRLVQQIANQCAIAIRQARLYEAAQTQVRELEKLNLVKDDFLKTISHELRTPMSSIRLAVGTLEALLEKEVGAKKSATFDKVLGIFRQACQRQNQLVDDLLTLCYADVGIETIAWEQIDLTTWLPEIAELYLDYFADRQQQLQLNISSSLALVRTDRKMLKRVINELLNNACKYTPTGEAISISTSNTPTTVQLSISNSGVEIPPEEQERIFDKFYRIPNHDPWQYGGTGIGLALVKKLVELLEAEITVSSHDNITTFTISFIL